MKTKKMAVIGYGGRGAIYGEYALKNPEKFELVAVAEIDKSRLSPLEGTNVKIYSDYREMLDAGLELDMVAISTQDAQHKEHSIYALERGYNLLLEKPIAPNEEDCYAIYESAKKNNCKVFVCHVLRYSPFYRRIKQIIDEGTLGDIINIHAMEGVGYYHMSNSFVRGPWRNSVESSPMILAKCCHDMDILRYLMGEKCISVNSYGSRKFFREECAPEGATQYCSDCPHAKTCVWNAQKIYTTPDYKWMAGYFVRNGDNSNENILKTLAKSQYDKCVFKNDNDVVDHQSTLMLFDKGKTAIHTMTGFSKRIYRDIKIFGTQAELYGHMEDNYIEIRPFEGEVQKINVDISMATIGGHNGSDFFMMEQLYRELNGEKGEGVTYLDVSIESHLMAFGAESSRLNNGETRVIKN
ncbi:MAG: Gfo/Idh/MocA family oxidoreductase [Clostridia bacterium]|nr:Gfo/Idh/MocA family oxidoreductase [Clostridia bacterium]